MGKRDEQYKLSGVVELDEGFFTTETPDSEKDKPKKRGRGSQNKSKVLVMAETADSKAEPKKGQKPKNPESVIQSDHSTSYTNFKSLVKEHVSRVIPKELVGTLLPWVHIAISNAKRQLLDIHHDICPEYLQSYLNEFCYKFNRRYFCDNVFERMLVACVAYKNRFRYNI